MSEYKPTGHRDVLIIIAALVIGNYVISGAETAARTMGPPWIATVLGVVFWLVLERGLRFFGLFSADGDYGSLGRRFPAFPPILFIAIGLAAVWVIVSAQLSVSKLPQYSDAFAGGVWLAIAGTGFAGWIRNRKMEITNE